MAKSPAQVIYFNSIHLWLLLNIFFFCFSLTNYCCCFFFQHFLFSLFPCAAAKTELIKSKLPNSVLSKIWKLADYNADGKQTKFYNNFRVRNQFNFLVFVFNFLQNSGFLDVEEFALAMHLINVKLDGNELPNSLPEHLIPPNQRLNGVE